MVTEVAFGPQVQPGRRPVAAAVEDDPAIGHSAVRVDPSRDGQGVCAEIQRRNCDVRFGQSWDEPGGCVGGVEPVPNRWPWSVEAPDRLESVGAGVSFQLVIGRVLPRDFV